MLDTQLTYNAQSCINGQWLDLSGASIPVMNPGNNNELTRVHMGTSEDVDVVVKAAHRAWKEWSAVSLQKRVHIMYRYRELLESHVDKIARLITTEHGKTLAESRGDIQRGIEVVELACSANRYLSGESQQEIASHIDAQTWRDPIGVCVGITPFNFPAMVPMWMFPIALVSGNTFILKPSEKVPLTACYLVKLAQEAGIPNGVLNIIHGDANVVDALCCHEHVAAISFVGSSHVAQHIYQLGTQHGKRVQAAGGAKNALVVLEDADIDNTVRNIMGAAYGCSGQRCMAVSVVITVGKEGDRLVNALCAAIDQLSIGDASTDSHVDMGPLIDEASKQRIHDGLECAYKEGANILRDGREHSLHGSFIKPSLIDHVDAQAELAQREWFGPLLCVIRADSLEQAVEWINQNDYGNGAVLCTQNAGAAHYFSTQVQCGMVGINVSVPAALAPYAFSGRKKSFFGDLHVQGQEGFLFYTQQKLILSRWDDNYQRNMGW